MISVFFPLKKLRRNSKCLLFSAILLVCAVAVYNEMYAARAWSSDPSMNAAVDENSWRRAMFDQWFRKDQVNYMEDSAAWASSYTPQTWKPEYKGQANLHVFEDWCGGSIAGLRKNLHYPLYPHTRTTVQKLAVSPQWTNYGLRIFGYLHPYIDGDFAFALSSDDNSEFWLSSDDSPLNVQLLAWVGKTGTEWTAPGEFDKYSTQTSRQVWLSAQRRYFFEVIHKQDHKGTDHVEVAWQFHGFDFMVIESRHMSLYVNESTFSMSDVTHIPQTAASHQITPPKQHSATVDMLRKDLRDTLYQVPLINSKFLQGVLPDCVYKPSYTIKDFPLLRYQGLKFVHMSYIYPNDYTRLTHMESESSCFYPESNFYFKMYGFSEYMRLDHPDMNGNGISDFDFQQKLVMHEDDDFDDNNERERESRRDQNNNALFPDYGDDFDDYNQKRTRKLFSVPVQEVNNMPNSSNTRLHMGKVQMRQKKYNVPQAQTEKPETPLPTQASKHHLEQKKGLGKKVQQVKPEGKRLPERQKRKSAAKKRQRRKSDLIQLKAQERPVVPTEQLITKKHPIQRSRSLNQTRIQRRKASKKPTVTKQQRIVTAQVEHHPDTRKHVTAPKRDIIPPLVRLDQRDPFIRKPLREKEMKMMVKPQDVDNDIDGPQMVTTKTDGDWSDTRGQEDMLMNEDRGDDLAGKQMYNRDSDSLWQPQEDSEGTDNEDFTPAPVFDAEVKWSQTFQFNHLDIQAQRSDRIDLHCNISGNLLLHSSDTLPVVEAFMEQLNKKHNGRFALERVVNVVKRVDKVLGNRYLLELLLRDGVSGQLLRLSKYVYVLIRLRGPRHWDRGFQNQQSDTVLSNPVGFRWNPDATVHFIIPVKNQGRWVRTLIDYMEKLFRETGDTNFNLIITDYDSTDMDVRKALQKSSLPRYQYVRLTGDFERSAGLQAGVDLINDDHSIVFLCDLHINFPSSIIDTIRKHCVEGYMAFAPIIMRLDCGATPLDPRGYWEVNGFGLLGIYKSDLNAVGGMNTKEFKKQWGGEDWELLDRILQAGLEVERIYLRNFFHHFHSRRGMWNRRIPPSPSHR